MESDIWSDNDYSWLVWGHFFKIYIIFVVILSI